MEASWRRNYLRYKSFFLNMLTQYKERSDWKAYLEILLSLATISVFSVFALRPTILTIAELIRQIEEKKSTVTKMDEKIQSLSSAQSLYDRQRSNIQLLISTSIPQRANFDIFARQIEGLSVKYQVGITQFFLGEAQVVGVDIPSGNPQATPETTQIEGAQGVPYSITSEVGVNQYSSVAALLKEFENLRTISQVGHLSLSTKEDTDTNEKTLILLLEGNLPYLMNEALK